jgi:hypothetical protein
VKTTISSPVMVLISWCRLSTLTAVISWIMASKTGRAVFHQMSPDFLEQAPPLLRRERLDQLLFGGGQDALKPDQKEIAQHVSVNVLGTPAHIVLFKVTDPPRRWRLRSLLGFS